MLTARRGGGPRNGLIDTGLGLGERLQQRGFRRLAAQTRAVVSALSGGRFSVDVNGMTVGGSPRHHGRYLRLLLHGGFGSPLFQLNVFAEELSPGMVVVDCGAHIGLHTVLAAHRVGTEGRVIALEPDPVNLTVLRENLEKNAITDRVEVIEAAASDHPGLVRLHLDSNLDVSMRATSSIDPLGGFPGGVRQGSESLHSSVEVPCVKLDDVIGAQRVDVVKIDVEGAEAKVLRGMTKTLQRSGRALTMFIECHPASLERGGTPPHEWLATLRDEGSLRLIDENRREVLPASDDEIAQLLEGLGGCRLMCGGARPRRACR
jgi:FkbM family methyltransferase